MRQKLSKESTPLTEYPCYPNSTICTYGPKSPKILTNASLIRGKLQEPAASTILDHPDGAVLILSDTAHALTH